MQEVSIQSVKAKRVVPSDTQTLLIRSVLFWIATFGLQSGVELADTPLRKLFLLTSEAAEHRSPFDDMTIHRLEYLGASRIRS